ncbi:MAG TPA: gluconolactonase, partial [Planctomycetaceae bacterium]|nr:gluconolactonase [Planctomycetaceae bacterium]
MILATCVLSLSQTELSAQDSTNYPTIGEVVRVDPGLDALIDKDARIEVLSSGFDWSEGPVWIGDAA